MPRRYVRILHHERTLYVREEVFDANPLASVGELAARSAHLDHLDELREKRDAGGFLHAADETTESFVIPRSRVHAEERAILGAVLAGALFLGGLGLAAFSAGWL